MRALSTVTSIAEEQEAKLWELCAAVSSPGFAIKTARPRPATSLHRSTNWFTEGFDTPDLKGAKELLSELS
jgi:hypothetical protein